MAIVCGTDLSERSRPAVAAAAAIARRAREPLWLVHVIVGGDLLEADCRVRLVAAAREMLAREAERVSGSLEAGVQQGVLVGHAVRERAEREGITTHVEIAHGPVVAEICTAAERLGVDVVCLGSRGESGFKALLGSVVAAVLRESARPVLVVRPPAA